MEPGLEHPWCEIYYTNILNYILQTRNKFEMCRILFEIVLSIFFVLKLKHERMREAALRRECQFRMPRLIVKGGGTT